MKLYKINNIFVKQNLYQSCTKCSVLFLPRDFPSMRHKVIYKHLTYLFYNFSWTIRINLNRKRFSFNFDPHPSPLAFVLNVSSFLDQIVMWSHDSLGYWIIGIYWIIPRELLVLLEHENVKSISRKHYLEFF